MGTKIKKFDGGGPVGDQGINNNMVTLPDGSMVTQQYALWLLSNDTTGKYSGDGIFGDNTDGSRYYGDTTAPTSAQEMFNQTYAEAMANEALAEIFETGADVRPPSLTKEDMLASLGTIDLTDGASQEEIDAATAFLDTGLVTIEEVAAIVGLPAAAVSAAYEATKPTVDDSAGEWYDPDTGLVIPDFDPSTANDISTLFPVFYPDVTQTSSSAAAAAAASSDAASSAASSDSSAASSDSSAASSAAQAAADAAAAAASSDSSAASSDSSAASSAAQDAADAAAAAGVTGGESITWQDVINYSLDKPKELTDEEIAANRAAAAKAEAAKVLEGQLEEAIAAETDPVVKARLEVELAKLKNQPTEALEAEVARLEAEAASVITGDPTQIGGNTVFTTDTSGLSDDAENVTLTPGQDITIVDTGTGTPAVDGDTKILTQEEKDAAFNEVLAGVDENTAIADVVAAAVEIYGNTADAVVAVAGAANSANVSAEDLANATGTSIEDINKAAEDANVAITNQESRRRQSRRRQSCCR
jgi:hypothetical protein